jgi:hypothetical protein
MRILSVIFMLITLNGCDYIFCKYRNLPDLGNGYRFDTVDCSTLDIVDSSNTVMVGGVILEYDFDSTYVVVSRRPWPPPDVPGFDTLTYTEENKAFENSTYKEYLILNKRQPSIYSLDTVSNTVSYSNVYGPFTKAEFLKKLVEFNIPDSVHLTQ